MDLRAQALSSWVQGFPQWQEGEIAALGGDASFRRYFRWSKGDVSVLLMDAPPPQEDIAPFLRVQTLMKGLNVRVPAIYQTQVEQGFMVLEDFGDVTFSAALSGANEVLVDGYYRQGLTQLSDWQVHQDCCASAASLPRYDATVLVREMNLLPEWLLSRYFDAPLSALEQADWHDWIRLLSGAALIQPLTLVHRDYHSRNLMQLKDGQFGVIDFQDALQGPLLYDAVSLLRDAYVQWPDDQVNEWLRFYFLRLVSKGVVAKDTWQSFVKSFDLMGVQRHIKVLGIFARLYHRDGKSGYLADLPRVAGYVQRVSARYPELYGLARWCEQRVQSKLS